MASLIFFICLFILSLRNRSVATYLYGFLILNLVAAFFTSGHYIIDSFESFFYVAFNTFILHLFISPWRHYKGIDNITFLDYKKVTRFTNLFLVISIPIFISLATIAVFTFTYSERINELKYSGVFMSLLYSKFPIMVKGYLLAYYLNPIAYFLIILHFFYLSYGKTRYAILSLIFSLNLVLYGLTFFSRWTLVNYFLIYLISYFLFKNALSKKWRRVIKLASIGTFVTLFFVFIFISSSRFDEDVSYENKIPTTSMIQHPTYYSFIDYLSQSHMNGMKLLENYDFNSTQGQNALSIPIKLISSYLPLGLENYNKIRIQKMPNNFWKFNGLVPELVYDFGYIITIIFALIYNIIVTALRPRDSKISLYRLFILILLVQLPLLSIFYSFLPTLIIPLIILIPVRFYLNGGSA